MKTYNGELEGFPEEIVNKMLDMQEEQGHTRDVTVFERNHVAGGGDSRGFVWMRTIEGDPFWSAVIESRNFNHFFEKYPERIEDYPKVMMVWIHDKQTAKPRIVFTEKCGKYLAWINAENIEDSEKTTTVVSWDNAEDPLTFNRNV